VQSEYQRQSAKGRVPVVIRVALPEEVTPAPSGYLRTPLARCEAFGFAFVGALRPTYPRAGGR